MNSNATTELEQLRRSNMELIIGNGEWAAKFHKYEEEKKKEEVAKKAVLEIVGELLIKMKTLEMEKTEQAERIAFLERENSELRLQSVTYTGRPTRDSNRLTVEDLVGPVKEVRFDIEEDADDNSSIPSLVSDNSDDSSMPSLEPVILEKPPLIRMTNDTNDPYGLYNNNYSVLPEIPEPAQEPGQDLLTLLDQYISTAQTRYYDQIDMEIERKYYADEEANVQAQAKANEEQDTEEKDGWLYYLKRQRLY
jgi:hypothetical protein